MRWVLLFCPSYRKIHVLTGGLRVSVSYCPYIFDGQPLPLPPTFPTLAQAFWILLPFHPMPWTWMEVIIELGDEKKLSVPLSTCRP